jgi:hypothetical protein
MRSLAAIALLALLALTPPASAADPARIALVSLCDPAKIATLTSDLAMHPEQGRPLLHHGRRQSRRQRLGAWAGRLGALCGDDERSSERDAGAGSMNPVP